MHGELQLTASFFCRLGSYVKESCSARFNRVTFFIDFENEAELCNIILLQLYETGPVTVLQ